MLVQTRERPITERDLRAALHRGRFALHYQPIHATEDLQRVAYESLVRWLDPDRGMIPPQHFIPIAEDCGLIREIGLWVLRQACRDLGALKTRYVGVNVSAIQLRQRAFASLFAAVIREEMVEPSQITVEITESVELRKGGAERRNLDSIRDLGCYLAIDDFGTGFASCDYVERFPFNVLKIDKSFVGQLGTSSMAEDAIGSICEMGRRRDLVIVAEGVETRQQLDILRQLGCPRVQGYLLGRPAPVTAIIRA